MGIFFWCIPLVVGTVAIYAVYVGGGGRTRLHRVAALSGAVTVLGLLGFFPLALATFVSALASTKNAPYQDLPLALYLGVLGVGVLGSAVSVVLLARSARTR